jgi:hypothetical protein
MCADANSRTLPEASRLSRRQPIEGPIAAKSPQKRWEGANEAKAIEGDTRAVMYECLDGINSKSIMEQAVATLRATGFQVPYLFSEEEGALTAVKGETWVTIESAAHYYTLVETKLTAPDYESINDAATMAEAIEHYGRVPLYGIHFLSGRADLAPESVTVLSSPSLDDNPDWNVRIKATRTTWERRRQPVLSLHRALAVSVSRGRGIRKRG